MILWRQTRRLYRYTMSTSYAISYRPWFINDVSFNVRYAWQIFIN